MSLLCKSPLGNIFFQPTSHLWTIPVELCMNQSIYQFTWLYLHSLNLSTYFLAFELKKWAFSIMLRFAARSKEFANDVKCFSGLFNKSDIKINYSNFACLKAASSDHYVHCWVNPSLRTGIIIIETTSPPTSQFPLYFTRSRPETNHQSHISIVS